MESRIVKEYKVTNLGEVADAIGTAMGDGHSLDVRSAGTKRHLGRVVTPDAVLQVGSMAGIVDYQPEELVMTLRAGTLMGEVEAALADARQMLAFEPPSMTKILGGVDPGVRGTIGGLVATNLSGPRRLTAGAARDFLLGFEAVSGRGELFKSGGKVMKNVTGYDLSKLMCGSFGTLAVMDEITLKTLPAPETGCSLLIGSDSYADAVACIARIFATPHEPGAAAILPQNVAKAERVDVGAAFVAIIRFEGIEASVRDRLSASQSIFGGEVVAAKASEQLWARLRDVQPLAEKPMDIWKVSCAPADSARVIAALQPRMDVRFMADWAGGLIWLAAANSVELGKTLRKITAGLDSGFAMLIRDVSITREKIPPFQPLSPAMFELHRRVKTAFDPKAVLNANRMHEGI